VRLKPDMFEAQLALGALDLQRGDAGDLERVAQILIRLQPSFPVGYLYLAKADMGRGDLIAAEVNLDKVHQLQPNNAAAYTMMGEIRLRQKKYSEAEKMFETALNHDSASTEAMSGLIADYMVQKQPKKAMDRLEAQIAKVPKSASFYMLLGQMQAGQHEYEKAEASLKQASELDPEDVNSLLLLGQVEVALGKVDQAIADCQESIKRNPRDARSYYHLGQLEESRGDWQKAQDSYKKALDIKSDFAFAANNLAYLMLQHGGNTDVALGLAQTARRGLPHEPRAADTLAWADYQKGAYGSAINLLEEALKVDPENPTYHYHLGLAYAKTNQGSRAKEHLQKTLDLDPQFPEAQEIRKALSDLAKS